MCTLVQFGSYRSFTGPIWVNACFLHRILRQQNQRNKVYGLLYQFMTAYPDPESKTTCIRLIMISYIIDHQVAQLALIANLATRWHLTGVYADPRSTLVSN